MARDASRLYIAQAPNGKIYSVRDSAIQASDPCLLPDFYCPNCIAEYEEQQPVTYVPEEQRFIHANVCRDCYNDGREKDRAHGLLQQLVLMQFRNGPQYSQAEVECSLHEADVWESYDVGALTPDHDTLTGIVVEIQHQSGCFTRRLPRRVRIAQHHKYGVCIVFSSEARGKRSFTKRLSEMRDDEVEIGGFDGSHARLGTMIRPGEDITPLRA